MAALTKLLEAAPRYVGLLKSQYWPAERLNLYREERIKSTLAAAAKIPFYAERLGKAPGAEDFPRLPILRRCDVDALYSSVRVIYPAGTPFTHAASSGTSGPRAEFLFDRSHQRGRNAARVRYLRANGWNPVQRSVWLAGAGFLNPNYNDGYEDRQFASRILVGVRFLAISEEFSKLAAEMAKIDPLYIYSYPSVLDGILRVFEERRLQLRSLRRVFCGGEVLDDSVRERARRVLEVDISENYGSTEAFIAWQCRAGNHHLNAEHVVVELVDEDGRQVAAGQIGRVLVTTLENYLMPLVRYEIGDYAVAAEGRCPCGRTLPLIGRVIGRGMNLFRRIDGTLLSTWDLVNTLLEIAAIKLFQIVQTAFDRMLIKYVADTELEREVESKIRSEFTTYVGTGMRIDFERLSRISRTPGGKYMVTLSQVSG